MTSHDPELAVARRLYDAFNAPTVAGVMAHFADGAVYEDPMGRQHVGKAAVQAALAPSFSGSQRYTLSDIFSRDGVVVATWTLEVGPSEGRLLLDGMDILTFSGEQVVLKQCYMKASALLMQPVPA